MWFFMLSCYALSFVSFLLLSAFIVESLLPVTVFPIHPLTLLILSSTVYLFTETLVIFFFVGTGVSIKEYVESHQADQLYRQRSFKIKMNVYPPLMLNLLIMIILFSVWGAVDTGRLPVGWFNLFFGAGILHFLYAKCVQHRAFRDMTQTILELTGTAHRCIPAPSKGPCDILSR